MKQNGVVCWPGPALLFVIFRFEYFILGPESYRNFRETGPRFLISKIYIKTICTLGKYDKALQCMLYSEGGLQIHEVIFSVLLIVIFT